jgi:hypothetical protein
MLEEPWFHQFMAKQTFKQAQTGDKDAADKPIVTVR